MHSLHWAHEVPSVDRIHDWISKKVVRDKDDNEKIKTSSQQDMKKSDTWSQKNHTYFITGVATSLKIGLKNRKK